MRIGFTSDIHIDFNKRHDFIDAFKVVVQKLELDALVFAGDTSNNFQEALDFYERLKEATSIKILATVGNHDQYDVELTGRKMNGIEVQMRSRQNYEAITYNKLYSILINPIVTKNWFITGIGGWYDYSFDANYPNIDFVKISKKRSAGFRWLDKFYVDGGLDTDVLDLEKVEESLEELRVSLKDPRAEGKQKCIVTHVLPTKYLAKPKPDIFATSTDYMGSEKYRELYEELDVSLSISGHSHHRKAIMLNGIKYVNVSLGYNFQWKNKLDVTKEILKSIYVLED